MTMLVVPATSVIAEEMVSPFEFTVKGLPLACVVVMVAALKASVPPAMVKKAFCPGASVPVLVNEIELTFTRPSVLVVDTTLPTAWLVPPNTRANVPEVVGAFPEGFQLPDVDQLRLPPPPVQVTSVWAVAESQAVAAATTASRTQRPVPRRAAQIEDIVVVVSRSMRSKLSRQPEDWTCRKGPFT